MPKDKKILEVQDSKSLLDSIPDSLRFLPDTLTDLAGRADRATSLVANGIKKKRKYNKKK